MSKKMLVVAHVAAEAAPLALAGGLGYVAGSLPKALATLSVKPFLILPRYAMIAASDLPQRRILEDVPVPFRSATEPVDVWQAALPGTDIPIYLIANERYVGNGGLYGADPSSSEASDRLIGFFRFSLFSRAIPEVLARLDAQPDIVHLHDSHPALSTIFLRQRFGAASPKTLLTIHNISFQGRIEWKVLENTFPNESRDFPPEMRYVSQGIAKANPLTAGILRADWVSTVSPTYRNEALSSEYGEYVDLWLRARGDRFVGILNGIDTDAFDPETDPSLFRRFSQDTLDARSENKKKLQASCGFSPDSDAFLLGIVSRLTDQKGFSILLEALPGLFAQLPNLRGAFLVTGEGPDLQRLRALEARYPKRFVLLDRFEEKRARRIYAGADAFLMPSRFEPCGLAQMFAMRYGSLPIVRATGGLKDTVVDASRRNGTGFVFEPYAADALADAIRRAEALFQNDPARWRKLQQNAMRRDFSWDASARKYVSLYGRMLAR